MRLGAIRGWQPAPGRVWELRPTRATEQAAGSAPVHPGLPSFLQADHLAAYDALRRRDDGLAHKAWTGVTGVLAGPLDADALGATLGGFLADHEGHRSWFDLDATPPRRHLVPTEVVTAPGAFELRPVDLGPDDGPGTAPFGERLHDHLDASFSATCTPGSWPGFGLLLVEVEDADTGPHVEFIWACDHAFTDAGSQLLLGSELAERYAAARSGTPAPADAVPTPDQRGSFLTYAADERERAATYGPDSPEVVAWREVVGAHGGRLPTFPLDLGLAPGEVAPVTILEADLVTGDDLVALERVVKGHGARLPSAVVAACALAGLRLAGEQRYLGVTVLGTREGGPWSRAQGWFCNFAPLAIDLTGHRTAGTVLAEAEAAFGRARGLATMPVHAALGVLVGEGTLDPASLGSPQLLSYLDLRWFPGATGGGAGGRSWEAGLHFTGEGRTRNASSWFQRDHARLYGASQAPDTPQAVAAVTTYLDEVATVLRTLARDGDLDLAGNASAGLVDASHLR